MCFSKLTGRLWPEPALRLLHEPKLAWTSGAQTDCTARAYQALGRCYTLGAAGAGVLSPWAPGPPHRLSPLLSGCQLRVLLVRDDTAGRSAPMLAEKSVTAATTNMTAVGIEHGHCVPRLSINDGEAVTHSQI